MSIARALTGAPREFLQLEFEGIPAEVPADALDSDAFLRQLHVLLLQLEVVTGKLVCAGCQRAYPIKDTIPNMLMFEHEVV